MRHTKSCTQRCKKINESSVSPFQPGSGRSGPPPPGVSWGSAQKPTLCLYTCHVGRGAKVGGALCKYASFPVPTKCCLSQLSEDQFSGLKRAIKQQNKQRVWRQESGQGAKLIPRAAVVSSKPPPASSMQAPGKERGCLPLTLAPPAPVLWRCPGSEGIGSVVPGPRRARRSPGNGAAALAVYRIQGSH